MAIPLFNVSSSTPQLKDTYNPIANTLSDQERRNKETGDKSVQILRTVQTSKLLKDFREIADPTVKQFNDFYNELSRYNPELAEKERERFYKKQASDAFTGKKKKSWDEPIPDDINKLEAELKQLESDLSEAESGNSTILDNGVKQNVEVPKETISNIEPNPSVDGNISEVSPVTKTDVTDGGDSGTIPIVSQDAKEGYPIILPNLQTLLSGMGKVGDTSQAGANVIRSNPANQPLNLPRMYQQEDYINLPRELGGTKKQPLNPLPRRI